MNAMTMGQELGPDRPYRPGDAGGAPTLVGHIPSVQATVHTGRLGRLDDVVGRISIFVVFIMWVVIPLAGTLGLVFGR